MGTNRLMSVRTLILVLVLNLGSRGEGRAESSPEQPYSYIIYADETTAYAKNGHSGQIDYQGADATNVIQSAMDSLKNGGKILMKEGTYKITPNPVALKPRSNITLEGAGNGATVIASSGSGAPSGSFFKTESGVENFVVRDICFDDALGANAKLTHQIFGFDYASSHIRIENCQFINLHNAGTIANADSAPYIRHFVYRGNRHSKHPASHMNGDYLEIMGKDIYILENVFDDTVPPGSAIYAISFGDNIWVVNNIIHKTEATATDGILFSALAVMDGYKYSYEDIFVIGNKLEYATLGIGSGGIDPYQKHGVRRAIVQNNILLGTTLQGAGGVYDACFSGNILKNSWIVYDGVPSGGQTAAIADNLLWANNIVDATGRSSAFYVLNAPAGSKCFMFKDNMIVNPETYNFSFNGAQVEHLMIEGNMGEPTKSFLLKGSYPNSYIKNNKSIGYVEKSSDSTASGTPGF